MNPLRRLYAGLILVVASAMAGGNVMAMTLAHTNLVDLLGEAQSIVVGQVSGLSDGIDGRGLPYTEVTLEIKETIKGSLSGTYTFRQFGLLEPRLSADGTRRMMPAPDGFPKFGPGEQVALFLNRSASLTGLQTTIGLANGKFTVGATRAENGMGNVGLFRNVSLNDGLATDNDIRMLGTEAGAVNSDTFLTFVRRAVQDSWVETCQIWRTDVGKTCPGSVGGGQRTPVQQKPSDQR